MADERDAITLEDPEPVEQFGEEADPPEDAGRAPSEEDLEPPEDTGGPERRRRRRQGRRRRGG